MLLTIPVDTYIFAYMHACIHSFRHTCFNLTLVEHCVQCMNVTCSAVVSRHVWNFLFVVSAVPLMSSHDSCDISMTSA